MILSSRPDELVVGSGPYTMKFKIEELELIGALLYVTRLGNGMYQDAAFNLIAAIESLMGGDFLEESSNAVSPIFSILDDQCDIIEQYSSESITIEV
ncbi:hypothetical protein [Acinetobacter sp.]|uniref:hypothetical protein n=1 Tax=Acinetobacter sp. TaxID=472 RepID=UPI00388F05AF